MLSIFFLMVFFLTLCRSQTKERMGLEDSGKNDHTF
jgi:hypothetical protein